MSVTVVCSREPGRGYGPLSHILGVGRRSMDFLFQRLGDPGGEGCEEPAPINSNDLGPATLSLGSVALTVTGSASRTGTALQPPLFNGLC